MTLTINPAKLRELEGKLGCTFRDDGIFAEMALCLHDYTEKTKPVPGVRFEMYHRDWQTLREAVAQVEDDWPQYFSEDADVFCAFVGDRIASFCILDWDVDCAVSAAGIRVGAVGCVGTIPEYRRRGIGLRMVDLATLALRDAGCDVSYIHYTHVDKWYSKLGYQTYARFSFVGREEE